MEIRISRIVKTYGGITAVDISDLLIIPDQIFGLVGLNGAGKTTLLRLILDLVKPDKGSVYINGADVAKKSDWKKCTGSYLDENFLFPFLSAEEYFQFVGQLYGYPATKVEQLISPYQEFFSANGKSGTQKLIRNLSAGNKKRVGLVSALMIRPKLLVLDEPFASLDPLGQVQLKTFLRSLHSENGTTIVLSSHNLYHVKDICERIGIIDQGKLIHDIALQDIVPEDLYAYFQPVKRSNIPGQIE